MIKFHKKFFNESIPFDDVNPDQLRQSNYRFRNIHSIENELTPSQIYPETELACKYNKPLFTKPTIQNFLSNMKTVST